VGNRGVLGPIAVLFVGTMAGMLLAEIGTRSLGLAPQVGVPEKQGSGSLSGSADW
jgi:hypothetical protein